METKKTLIITGGQVDIAFAEQFVKAQTFDYIIAADHGLMIAKRLQIIPDAIVGDFDSIDVSVLEQFKQNKNINICEFKPEKDDTDTEIAINLAIEMKSNEVAILGATGNRIDHTLANIQLLKKFNIHNIAAYLIDANNKIYMIEEGIRLQKRETFGHYVSLLPISEAVENVTLIGFKYPLLRHTLIHGESLGISNEIVEEEASISFTSGTLLVIEAQD